MNNSIQGTREGSDEKNRVAMMSVLAAVFLTGSKLVIGVMTGSLGILSEALHSGLDMVAAVITWISVRISGRPADSDHNFGHGKIENLSALAETFLLLVTCVWIIYEAVSRLAGGRTDIEVNAWSFAVVIVSMAVDLTRSRALMKAARKHDSDALRADALHFSTDIWSSLVVLLGLVCFTLGYHRADAIAALMVACIVIYVSLRLGYRSVSILLDAAPSGIAGRIENLLGEIPGIVSWHDLRVRVAGPDVFVDLCIHLDPSMTISSAHAISEEIEGRIRTIVPRSIVHVHEEPDCPHDGM